VIDISRKDLEASNSLLDDLNRLVAQKMGLPAPVIFLKSACLSNRYMGTFLSSRNGHFRLSEATIM